MTDTYQNHGLIGNGKEGHVYAVYKNGERCALKKFKKGKCKILLRTELEFQYIASKYGIAPKIIEYDLDLKYILMETMDCHLTDLITKNKGILSKKHQLNILDIFNTLDRLKIYQSDPNILNFMIKGDIIYMIDYGMCKKIDNQLVKKLNTEKPNYQYTLLSLILKLKEGRCNPLSYKYLSCHL